MSPSTLEPVASRGALGLANAGAALRAHLQQRRLWPDWRTPHVMYFRGVGEPLLHFAPGVPQGRPVADWAAWCAQHPGAVVHGVLASSQCHTWLRTPVERPALRHADVVAHARQQFVHYHGAEAKRWPVVAWAQGRLEAACALPGDNLARWQGAAAAQGVWLARLQPWWAVAWAAALQRHAPWATRERHALVLVDGARVWWLWGQQGQVQQVAVRRLPQADGLALATLLQALQHEAAVPAAATLLAGCGLNGDLATLQGLRHGAGLEAVRADAMAREWVQA